jgi:protein-tyrosine phosphatase
LATVRTRLAAAPEPVPDHPPGAAEPRPLAPRINPTLAWISAVALSGTTRRPPTRNVERLIDLHCHVLPGIDDGPANFEQSVALALAARADGTETVVATPHVSARYRNDADTIARLVADLRARLADNHAIPAAPRVLSGAEIALTQVAEIGPEELSMLGLGGGPWLLIEPPMTEVALGVQSIVDELHGRGHRVLLAHPERCPAFLRDPRLLRSLVDAGALTSVTASSFGGRFGANVGRFAHWLLEEGMLHNAASDFHSIAGRPPLLASVLEQAGLGALADWLTVQVPTAILGNSEIPPRPTVRVPALSERRRWWRR